MSNSTTFKICKGCGQELPLDEFYKSQTNKDGRINFCKTCYSIRGGHTPYSRSKVPDGFKQCSRCKVVKLATTEFFCPRKAGKLKLKSWCRNCDSEYQTSKWIERKRKIRAVDINGNMECVDCREVKPANSMYFVVDKRHPTGLAGRCRDCANRRAAELRRSKGVKIVHPTRVTSDGRQECRTCHELKPLTHEYFHRKQNRRNGFSAICKVCKREQDRLYRLRNLSRLRQYSRDYHYTNYAQIKVYQAQWRQDNRAKANAPHIRYRSRERLLPDAFTDADWRYVLEYFNHRCAACGRPRGLWHTLAADHWVPLNDPRPDNPGTVPWNIVPLCHGRGGCNNSKADRDPVEWLNEKFGPRKAKQILARIQAYFDSLKDKPDK